MESTGRNHAFYTERLHSHRVESCRMLLIQYFRMRWDKSTRGALEGKKRRAVAETFSFPASVLPKEDEVWLHRVSAGNEGQVFSSPATRLDRAELFEFPIFYSSVEIRQKQAVCTVRRRESSVPVFSLALGETGRVRIQGCNCNFEQVWYEKHVFNVALLDRYDSEVFRLRPFTHCYDDMRDLRFAPSSTT